VPLRSYVLVREDIGENAAVGQPADPVSVVHRLGDLEA
jgi:hypothetical protein